MSQPFLTVKSGKFHYTCAGVTTEFPGTVEGVDSLVHAMRLTPKGFQGVICSSSVDHPEEYGVPQEVMNHLWAKELDTEIEDVIDCSDMGDLFKGLDTQEIVVMSNSDWEILRMIVARHPECHKELKEADLKTAKVHLETEKETVDG